jgi:alpha-galactosidase
MSNLIKVKISLFFFSAVLVLNAAGADSPELRTPPAPATPRLNGPDVFGVRPGHPFLYHLPATGQQPIQFSADKLPAGLSLDPRTGDITGSLSKKGKYVMTFYAKNALGTADKKFKIVVGETIALTPPMGWNSWNHYAGQVSQKIVLENAQAMAASGLMDHGWTYVNIDDTWQGLRGGSFNGLQGNEKFSDMTGLCDAVHALGLKIGIYSTPWVTSYAGHAGGSAENPQGDWQPLKIARKTNKNALSKAIREYHFATNDASQWAAWGIDYLKYDWHPILYPATKEMSDALRHSGRDIVFSLSNDMNLTNAPAISKIANSWRTTGDIKANWPTMSQRGSTRTNGRRSPAQAIGTTPTCSKSARARKISPA